MYAKLINNTLHRTPNKVQHDGTTVFNPSADILAQLGYLPVTYTDMPADAPDGQHYIARWEQTEEAIVQVWALVDDPIYQEPEPTPEERITTLEEQQERTDAAVQDLILTMLGGE